MTHLGLYTLLLNALVFVLMGLAFMILPATMVELVTGGIPQTPSGMIDVRATYGGGFAGIGLTLFATVLRPGWRSLGLLLLVFVLGGMALGRGLGIVTDGRPNIFMYLFLAYELVFVAVALVALVIQRRPQG